MTRILILHFLVAATLLFPSSRLVRAAQFENEVILSEVTAEAGLRSWFLKKYKEDFFDSEVAKSSKELLWLDGGITFGYLPGNGSRNSDLRSIERTIRGNGSSTPIVVTCTDESGGVLPKGIKLRQQWQFSSRYSARLSLSLENLTDETIEMVDEERGLPILLAFPLFKDDFNRTEAVRLPDKSEEETTVSPSVDTIEALDEGTKWVGARNQYYCFGLRETTDAGRYVMTKFDTLLKAEGDEKKKARALLVGWKFGWTKLRSREKLTAEFEIYLGPKQQSELEGTGFELLFNTWDGLTGPIGRLMFSLLHFFYGLTKNYGYAILLLTLLVKLILLPVNRKQMIAMKKVQQLQPKIQAIKEKYPDSQKQQVEMQKLFVEYQVNPLAGCLPILVQIPVFVALYTSLSSAIELKNVPFMWLPDLSQPDPYCILPIAFSVSIFYSSQANASGDQSQAAVMKIMPVFMFFVFMNMASGVMLYIAGQSMFSMFEQQFNKLTLETTPGLEKTPDGEQGATSTAAGNKTKKKSKRKK